MAGKKRAAQAAAVLAVDAGLREAPTVRTEPFKVTLNLDPGVHDELLRWSAEVGREIGARVSAAPAVRILLDRLFTDEDLAAKWYGAED